ncbi:multidrug effflux MFS transporter [Burkholderia anthina]|uniref:multidrug effflux MFS transporter n=1 Tax=Burkholderia anthina TaxID=179879 RepID=UPI001FC89462|nr:multidrug effflux MFS transporter [Burkholderia anthina]
MKTSQRPALSQLAPSQRSPLWLLALITLTGTLAMHVFVPALPIAASDLRASASAVQLTLSFYIAGLAIGQLIYGPASDRFGRRPVLIFGMVIYAISCFAAYLAPTIKTLILARLFQALGGCSGLVLGRAIIRDSVAGNDAAKRLSTLNLIIMAGPGLAPLIGSVVAESFGWRSIFSLLATFGTLNVILVFFLLGETAEGVGRKSASLAYNYAHLLRSRRFVCFAFGGGCATTSLYAFIGAAPFIFVNQLHRSAHEVGTYLALNIAGVWLGNLSALNLIGRVTVSRLMVTGNALSCIGAAAFFISVMSGHLSMTLTIVPLLVLTYGAGIAAPTAMAEALNVNPTIIGSSSGLYGFTQMSVGAACTVLAGLGENHALAAACTLLAAGCLSQFSFWLARRSDQ